MRGLAARQAEAAEVGAELERLGDVAADPGGEEFGDGADLLGVAVGDGTQVLVAGIAAEHDLPFLVISAGTRNHFALDLGLDRDKPGRLPGSAHRGRCGTAD